MITVSIRLKSDAIKRCNFTMVAEFFLSRRIFWSVWPYYLEGGCVYYGTAETVRLQSVCSWKEGTLHGVKYRQNVGVVGERFCEAVLSSPHPWQSPDCIPIVGSVKALVPNDKSFNHTKVWCTFMFIDLQATSCVSSAYTYYNILSLNFPECNYLFRRYR